jgi:transcriptional regulator with XRE-family HTH domain
MPFLCNNIAERRDTMNRLKELRLLLGWNMKEAAQKIGIPYTTYVSYEKGEREMNSEVLIKLADFFGCSVDYLLGKSDSPDGGDDTDELADVLQLLKDREDLRALLHVSARNTPEQVRRLAKLMESMNEE